MLKDESDLNSNYKKDAFLFLLSKIKPPSGRQGRKIKRKGPIGIKQDGSKPIKRLQ